MSNIMYQMRQIVKHDLSTEIPKCMYNMKNIHSKKERSPSSKDHVFEAKKNLSITEQVNQFLKNHQESEMTALENQQLRILQQLSELKNQMLEIKKTLRSNQENTPLVIAKPEEKNILMTENLPNLVINANISYPPYSLLCLQKLWSKKINLKIQTYVHSSVSKIPKEISSFSSELESYQCKNAIPTIFIRLVWKDIGADAELKTNEIYVVGEVNILRYISRLTRNQLIYESSPKVLEIDTILDLCYLLLRSKLKTDRKNLQQQLEKKLGKSTWFCNSSDISIADIAVYSCVKNLAPDINSSLNNWFKKCVEIK